VVYFLSDAMGENLMVRGDLDDQLENMEQSLLFETLRDVIDDDDWSPGEYGGQMRDILAKADAGHKMSARQLNSVRAHLRANFKIWY
jgi:hypothetical protein